jgi:hypothetical protein
MTAVMAVIVVLDRATWITSRNKPAGSGWQQLQFRLFNNKL